MNVILPTPEGLLAAGFVAVRYEGQDGIFYRRDTEVGSMPYLSRQADGEIFADSDVAVTEVGPNGKVQLMVCETDYYEAPVQAASEEGQGLLRDAVAGRATDKFLATVLRP